MPSVDVFEPVSIGKSSSDQFFELRSGSLLDSVLKAKGFTDARSIKSFLWDDLSHLHSPFLFEEMESALSCFESVYKAKGKIRVFGDYDADGVTATVILVSFLRSLGLATDYYIPHRLDEGYGLSPASVKDAVKDGIDLAFTVDCGISSVDEIALLSSNGVKSILLDHHEPPDKIPVAVAVINPRCKNSSYPFKELAGVGVVFKFIQAVSERFSLLFPTQYIPLVALGTIGDIMPLVGENRIIVREALQMLSENSHFTPLTLMVEKFCRNKPSVKELSYMVCPKINAAGRMGHAGLAVDYLLCSEQSEAEEYLSEIIALNRERQKTEEKMRREIIFKLQDDPFFSQSKIGVIEGDSLHSGVIGITASKLSDLFNIPIFIIALSGDKGRGSARGTSGYNIYKILAENSELFEEFGGHACAGGFSIRRDNIPLLKERLKYIEPSEDEPSDNPEFYFETSFTALNIQDISELSLLEPFGEGNPAPVFLFRGVKIEEAEVVGRGGHLRLKMRHDGCEYKGIYFRKGNLYSKLEINDYLYDIAAFPSVEEYMGRKYISLMISDIIIPLDNGAHESEAGVRVIDARNSAGRILYIKQQLKKSDSLAVVVRTPQQKQKLEYIFSGEDFCSDEMIKQPPVIFFRDFDKNLPCEDVVLFAPPPSFEHFGSVFYKEVKRIHLLFTPQDVEWEASAQELAYPEFEKLVKIRSAILNNGKVLPASVASILDDASIRPITVDIAIKIFIELGLAALEGGLIKVVEPEEFSQLHLCKSKTYQAISAGKSAFEEVKTICMGNFAEIRDKILSFI